jgi:hypothetical protein
MEAAFAKLSAYFNKAMENKSYLTRTPTFKFTGSSGLSWLRNS